MRYRICFIWLMLLLSHPALAQQTDENVSQQSAANSVNTSMANVPSEQVDDAVTPPSVTDATGQKTTQKSVQRTTTPVGDGIVTADPISVIGGLLIVLLFIFLIAWLVKRIGALPLSNNMAVMKTIAAISVGPREKVVLIEVGEQQILVGVAPGRVSHLHTLETKIDSNSPSASSEFSKKLKQILSPEVQAGRQQ